MRYWEADAGLFYVFLWKHYCPVCNQLLMRYNEKEILTANSEEARKARNFDGMYTIGFKLNKDDVVKYYPVFKCETCNMVYSITEMKALKI
jgi:hypothetical protein